MFLSSSLASFTYEKKGDEGDVLQAFMRKVIFYNPEREFYSDVTNLTSFFSNWISWYRSDYTHSLPMVIVIVTFCQPVRPNLVHPPGVGYFPELNVRGFLNKGLSFSE